MMRIGAVAVFAALAWGALGCSSSSPIDGARQSWKRTVETCPTYHYAMTDSSFSGFSARTTIVISDGRPIARGCVQTQGFGPERAVTASWIEEAGHIGEHAECRPAKTMEQLQDDCARNVLGQDPAKNQVMFSTDDRGVLLECWYVPKGCADDCTMGVVVEDFACGTLVLADGGTADAAAASDAGQPQDADAAAGDADPVATSTEP
jgi:hypothetical protein